MNEHSGFRQLPDDVRLSGIVPMRPVKTRQFKRRREANWFLFLYFAIQTLLIFAVSMPCA
jgi:hypothetical protein